MKTIFVIAKCGFPNNIGCEILEELAARLEYKCIIAEKKYSTIGKDLLKDIYDDIKKADLVFVDFIPSNFNIAFESGLTYVINDFNNSINKKNKPGVCFLIPQYIFDLNRIPSDIKGIKFSFYNNYKAYTESAYLYIKHFFEDEKDHIESKEIEIVEFINSIKKNNIENFLDFNSLFEKFKLNNSQFNLSGEGIQISNAHFPIYFKNFGFFSDYELIIDGRIDRNCIGFALHIGTEEDIGTSFFTIPIPLKFFMFNISEKGILLPHIFDRLIIHHSLHYWPFYNSTNKFDNVKIGEFFKLIIRVNKNIISMSVGEQSFTYDIKKLDFSGFDNKKCSNDFFKNNVDAFKKYIKEEVLNKLTMGSFGFRIHPGELATIKRLELNVY